MDHRSSARPQIPQRPVSQLQTEEQGPTRSHATWSPSVEPPHRKRKWPLIAAIGVVVIVALVLFWFMFAKGVSLKTPATDRYQAVFLDNGQIFFGKLKNIDGTYLVLENAYYAKEQKIPENATEEQKAAIVNNVSLAKVGSEVYGPEPTVSIRAEQVLFWQNLQEDSKVSRAIEDAN